MCCSLAGARAGEPLGSGARRRRQACVPFRALARARSASLLTRRGRAFGPCRARGELRLEECGREAGAGLLTSAAPSNRNIHAVCTLIGLTAELSRRLVSGLQNQQLSSLVPREASHGTMIRPCTRRGLDRPSSPWQRDTQRSGQHDARRARERELIIGSIS